MDNLTIRFLDLFVSIRYWLLPLFVSLYYAQSQLLSSFLIPKRIILIILLVIIGLAIPANYMWVVDYRRRLTSGVKFLNEVQTSSDEKEAIAQVRWSNAKLLAVVVIILEILAHYDHIDSIPIEHRVPALAVALLILVALFDSALDLEAEWTISILVSVKNVDSSGNEKGILAKAIWKTNQFKLRQNELYEKVRSKQEPKINFGSFSSTAQNVISFAVIVVFYLSLVIFRLLFTELWNTYS
jgi:hypothetical protein